MKNFILILTALLALASLAQARLKAPKKQPGFMPTLVNITATTSWDALYNVTRATEYCLVYFNKNSTTSREHDLNFQRMVVKEFKRPITFISFSFTSETLQEQHDAGILDVPSFALSINGHFKRYTGLVKTHPLRVWVEEILEAKPLRRKSRHDIEHIDKHYFVYVSKKLFKSHQKYINTLAKLISPLMVYTGFNRTELRASLHDPDLSDHAFVYREYGHEHHPLNFSIPVSEQAHKIIKEEFPLSVVCDDKSYRFLVEFKIPVLFFYSNGTDEGTWEMIKGLGVKYHEYLMTVKVDSTKHDRCNLFARQFLQVTKAPAIRILNLSKEVRRYKFFGPVDQDHVSFFVSNYVSGNLKSFQLNQRLKLGANIKGVPSANFKMFRKAIGDYNHRYLIYVYDPFVPDLNNDLAVLKSLAGRMAANKSFKVMAIDHFQNDVDRFHNMNLPITFLILRKGKFALYEKGKLTRAGLAEHIKKHLPNMELGNEVETDL